MIHNVTLYDHIECNMVRQNLTIWYNRVYEDLIYEKEDIEQITSTQHLIPFQSIFFTSLQPSLNHTCSLLSSIPHSNPLSITPILSYLLTLIPTLSQSHLFSAIFFPSFQPSLNHASSLLSYYPHSNPLSITPVLSQHVSKCSKCEHKQGSVKDSRTSPSSPYSQLLYTH